jgi:integrase
MSIKEIEKGKRYLVRVPTGYTVRGVVRHHNKVIRGNLTEARNYEREKLSERNKGLPLTSSALTISAYFKRWADNLERKQLIRPITLEIYRSYIRRYIEPAFGSVKLSALQPFHVENMVEEMLKQGLNPNTVRYAYGVVHAGLAQAVRWRHIYYNPSDAVKPPPAKQPKARSLTRNEAKALIQAALQWKHGLAFIFALLTGMRPEEYFGMAWSDIDLDRCLVTVRRTVMFLNRGGWYFSEPKTKRSGRTVKFPAFLSRLLVEHRKKQQEAIMRTRKFYRTDLDLVFANQLGTPLNRKDVGTDYFKPVCAAAGIKGRVTLYTLRHTYATLLLADGENPKTVSDALGHSKVSFTLDTYAHVLPEMKERSAERLERLLSG